MENFQYLVYSLIVLQIGSIYPEAPGQGRWQGRKGSHIPEHLPLGGDNRIDFVSKFLACVGVLGGLLFVSLKALAGSVPEFGVTKIKSQCHMRVSISECLQREARGSTQTEKMSER